jgi:tetratricopeptide (TPR) repeat protein
LMKGKNIEKRAIYFESLVANFTRGWAPLRGYIDEKSKFIDSPLPEYYNLKDDFFEQDNLIQNIDVASHKAKMKELMDKFSSLENPRDPQRLDSDTRKRLESLGYISSLPTQIIKSFGPEDDLKTLLPFQQKKIAAIMMFENNQVQEAVKLLNDIVQKRNDFADAYIDLSRIYRSQGLEKEALEVLETGFENNPENYALIVSCGFLLVEMGLIDRGIEFLQKALDRIDRDPDVWGHLGIAYTIKGEYQNALECYEKALHLDRTNAVIYDNLGFLYFSIYQQSGKKEDNMKALACFQKAIDHDPGLTSAYNGLGGAYKAGGQIDKAIEAWEKSLELDPDYGFSLYNLGVAYLQIGEKEKALKHFERYLFLNYKTLTPQERQEIQKLIDQCKK